MRFFLVALIIFLLSSPAVFAQSNETERASEEPDEVIVSDSTAIRAIDEAYTCIDEYQAALQTNNKSRIVSAVRSATRSEILFGLYLERASLSSEEVKFVSGVRSIMSRMSSGMAEKMVVSDLSDQGRVAMPVYTIIKVMKTKLDKFTIKK